MKTPAPMVRQAEESLTMLARRANVKHAACLKDNRSALDRAHETGVALALAQKQIYATRGHEWLKWVEANLDFDRWRAAEYLRIAENWKQIEASCANSPHMGLREALNLLTGDCNMPQLEAWETAAPPPAERSTVAAQAETTIDEALASLPAEEQRDVIARTEARLEERERDDAERETGDAKPTKRKQALSHFEKGRKTLVGLEDREDRPAIKHAEKAARATRDVMEKQEA